MPQEHVEQAVYAGFKAQGSTGVRGVDLSPGGERGAA